MAPMLKNTLLLSVLSLAALVGAALCVVWMLVFGQAQMALLGVALAGLVYIRHSANISRLLKGEEPRIGADK